jgi:hypothetical protein
MSAYCPLSPARSDHSAQQTDRAAIRSDDRRPVPSPTAASRSGQFQSDTDFAIPRWALTVVAAARRADRHALPIAFAGVLFGAIPPLCMALAGGTPA